MRLKILNDRIVDAETDDLVLGVTDVLIHMDYSGVYAVIKVQNPDIDIDGIDSINVVHN